MNKLEMEGYEWAKGAMRYVARYAFIASLLVGGFLVLRLACGWGMDDSDKNRWSRSGFTIMTDHKTGIEYLSDGHGGLVRREYR